MKDILEVLDDAKKTIAKRGFANIVSTRMSRGGQVCVHTLGMPAQGLADLVIFMNAEGTDLAGKLINEVATLQITQGKFTSGRKLRNEVFNGEQLNANAELLLLEVEAANLDIFALNKVLLHDRKYTQEGFQITYPDDQGRYPWMLGSEVADITMVARPPQ